MGIETLHLFPTVDYECTCRQQQTNDNVILETPDLFPENSISLTGWNSQNLWMMNINSFSTIQVLQSFSHKSKSLFLQSCPKDIIRFLCEYILNLLKGNLQNIKRHQVTDYQNEVWSLSLKRIDSKQKRVVLATEKRLLLIKVFTPPVINHLPWYGEVCFCPCLCLKKQEFEHADSYKAEATKVSGWTKSHVPNWFASVGNKQKTVSQSRLFGRQNFVMPTYQVFIFANFKCGWCTDWSFALRLCSTSLLLKRRRSWQLLDFTWRCGDIFKSGSESKYHSQGEKKQGPFQNKNVRSCNNCTRKGCCVWIRLRFGKN